MKKKYIKFLFRRGKSVLNTSELLKNAVKLVSVTTFSSIQKCRSFLCNNILFFENVFLVSYIIYLHCAGLTFPTKSHIRIVTVAHVTFVFLTRCSRVQEKVTGGTCRCWTGPARERRSLDPANSSQACLTGTGTRRCDTAHFTQSTHAHEREREGSWSALKGQVFCNDAQETLIVVWIGVTGVPL